MSILVSFSGYLIAIVATFVSIAIVYFKWMYQHFEKRGIPYLKPQIPFGNFGETLKGRETFGVDMLNIYNEMKQKGWKYGGMFLFASPNIVILDLDVIRNILTKDFQYFTDRTTYVNEKDDPLSANLANINGNRWKNLRAKLTPTFTSGKMKTMFHTLAECKDLLYKRIDKQIDQAIDIKNILACFTTDAIGSCAFGLDCKAIEDDESPFRVYGKKAATPTWFTSFKSAFGASFPNLAKFLHVTITKPDVATFFMKMITDAVSYREKNNIQRNDMLQMLIDLKNKKSDEALTMNELAAQALIFFVGGFETSSTLMSFALYELGKNLDIQEKLRTEIKTVLKKYDGKITYEAVQDMTYLTQVLEETLRLYTPAPFTNRQCQKDYKIPEYNILIEKGSTIAIPIWAIHLDSEYYPEPKKFNPDRFSEENKASRHRFAYMPFGEGPRICIGLRFGLLQAKVGIAALLNNYKFSVNKKTKEPFKFVPSNIILTVEGDIWLNVEKL